MDFWKTLLVLLKRWYVALPVFAVSLGGAGTVYAIMPMHYESTGVIVLTSPASGPTSTVKGDTGQTNPLLAFESSLAISASIVIQSINTPEVIKEMGADKPDHTFLLTGGAEGGPFIKVKTESKSEAGSRELVVQVLDRVKAELTKRQESLGAAKSTFIGVDDVVPPTKPEPLRGGKLRAAGVALVLGLVASLAAVFGFESYQTRKRRKADGDDADVDEYDGDDTDDTDSAKPKAKSAAATTKAKARTRAAEPDDEPVIPPQKPSTQKPSTPKPSAPQPAVQKPATPQPVGADLTQRVAPVRANGGNGGPGQQSAPRTAQGTQNGQGAPNGQKSQNGQNGQRPVPAGQANGKPAADAGPMPSTTRVNGQPMGTGGPRGSWPSEEYREPPTTRMKPVPPDQRS